MKTTEVVIYWKTGRTTGTTSLTVKGKDEKMPTSKDVSRAIKRWKKLKANANKTVLGVKL